MAASIGKQYQRPRHFYLDNLKSSLTALVIYHHTAISYGGLGLGLYQSTFHPPASSIALVGFNAINQSFFMGSFFFLSATLSRKALQRKSRRAFVKDRLYRLGLPTLAYTVLGRPCCLGLMRLASGESIGLSLLADHWRSLRGISGPVWFTGLLLLFDLAHAFWLPDVGPNRDAMVGKNDSKGLGINFKSGLALGACVAASFAARCVFPVGTMFVPLCLQLGYLPQYIAAYVYGACVADPIEALPSRPFTAILLSSGAISSTAIGRAMVSDAFALSKMKGGFNYSAFAYAVWNESVGYLLGAFVLSGFKSFANFSWGTIGSYAYQAFLWHMPVSVLIETLTDGWEASGVAKTATIGTLNVVGSWSVGYVVSQTATAWGF